MHGFHNGKVDHLNNLFDLMITTWSSTGLAPILLSQIFMTRGIKMRNLTLVSNVIC